VQNSFKTSSRTNTSSAHSTCKQPKPNKRCYSFSYYLTCVFLSLMQ